MKGLPKHEATDRSSVGSFHASRYACASRGSIANQQPGLPPISALTECIQNIANMADEPRTVSALKELRDYAGNVYYVCELSPTGYSIPDASYGTILEYFPSALSPYLDVKDDIIYLGPT